MRMRHPNLDTVIYVPDDAGCVAAHRESGWVEAPDVEAQQHPGLMPGEQALDEPEPVKAKRAKSEADPTD